MNIDASLFRPLRIEDRSRFIAHLEAFPTPCSHYNFAAVYCWQDEYRTTWQIHEGRLLLHNGLSDVLLMPLGPEISLKELVALSRSLREQGHRGRIGLVPPDFPQRFPEAEKHFHFVRDDDNADYIYSTSLLAELRGRKLARKRNQIHQFINAFPDHTGREIQPLEWPQCLDLAARWSRKQLNLPLARSPESQALQRALPHCRQLGLNGYGLFADRRMVGFSVWSRQNSDMFTIHFEKFDPAVQGSSQMINRETARFLHPFVQWINREQDLGIPGL